MRTTRIDGILRASPLASWYMIFTATFESCMGQSMNRFSRFLGLAALLVGQAGFAEQVTFQDSFLDRLVGRWVLRGEIAGKQTIHDVTSEWVLGHQYLRLHEVSREKSAKGRPAYEAMVFIGWDHSTQEYACLWLDATATSSFSSDGRRPCKKGRR